MNLPCPHCRTRFNLTAESLKQGSAKLKCPACQGVFAVRTQEGEKKVRATLICPDANPSTDREPAKPVDNRCDEATTTGARTEYTPPPQIDHAHEQKRQARNKFLTGARLRLLLAFGLLLAITGFLVPALKRGTAPSREGQRPANQAPGRLLTGEEPAQRKADTNLDKERTGRVRDASVETSEGSLYQALYPFSTTGQEMTCESLLNIQKSRLQASDTGACSTYSLWIAYLAVNTPDKHRPGCPLESPFGLAASAIRKGNLCGRGYAFLSVYYAQKKIADRSLSFLQEAKLRAPEDPWAHLAEALYSQKVFEDTDRASTLLSKLTDKQEVAPVARYLLSGIHIVRGDYQEAANVFGPLVEQYPHQELFLRIERILSSLGEAPYYSRETAQGLLGLSRAFASMLNLSMAEKLCVKVLEEMPGRLPLKERAEAYFNLGTIYERRGDRDNAYVSYRNVLRLDPHFREAHQRIQNLISHPSEKS